MPCTDSITLKPSGKLSTCISEEPSICESSAGPLFSHWGQRRFSTQRSREDIFHICACGAPIQPQPRCHTQTDSLPPPSPPWNARSFERRRFIGKYRQRGRPDIRDARTSVGRLKSARRKPLVDVQSYLQLPGPASQKFTLPALREGFDLLFDAKSFQRQVLVEQGFGLVGLGTRHNYSPDRSGGSMQHSLSPITAYMVR